MTRPALVALTVLACAGGAQAAQRGRFVALPTPLAQLSSSPPLAGGANATSEVVRHRVDARTGVDVAVDNSGTPFRVRVTHRLDVRVKGDYFFTIGAPVVAVEAAPGSDSTPGRRAASILWAGFNPLRRTLVARATLDPVAVAPSLPLRVEVANGATAGTGFANQHDTEACKSAKGAMFRAFILSAMPVSAKRFRYRRHFAGR